MTTPLVILFCWTISFFFAGIESGLLSIDPVRLRHHVKRRSSAALRLDRLLQKPERLLVTVLLITNLADIVALLLLTQYFVIRYGAAGFWITIALTLPVYLLFLNVLPKTLFRRFPFRALARLAGVLEFVSLLLWPVLQIGSLFRRLVLRRRENPRLFAAREELKQITSESEREGSLTATERQMIHNVVDFRSVRVCDVMIAGANVVTVDPDAPISSVMELSRTKSIERLPVVNREKQALGLVNVLDILFDKNGAQTVRPYIRRILTVSEKDPAYLVVQRLRAARLGLAAVVDRGKNLAGIVTIEDLIRRLVSLSETRP